MSNDNDPQSDDNSNDQSNNAESPADAEATEEAESDRASDDSSTSPSAGDVTVPTPVVAPLPPPTSSFQIPPRVVDPSEPAPRPRRGRWLTVGAVVGAFVVGGLIGAAVGRNVADRNDGRPGRSEQVHAENNGAENKSMGNADHGDDAGHRQGRQGRDGHENIGRGRGGGFGDRSQRR